jgi:hypothetical protein
MNVNEEGLGQVGEAAQEGEPLDIGSTGLFEGMVADGSLAEGGESSLGGEGAVEPPQYFIGELTQDQVLQALQLAQQVPDIRTHVERSVMGRLGPIAKDLKDLRASGIREWSFDAGKSPGLAKIRDLDKGIGDALAEVLAELKVQTMEIPAAVSPLLDERMQQAEASQWDKMQDELLLNFIPDAYKLGPTAEFAEFLKTQPLDVQDLLQGWGREGAALGSKNARVAISTFNAFKAAEQAKALKAAEVATAKANKAAGLRKAVDAGRTGGGGGMSAPMSEQDALNERLKNNGAAFWLRP